MWEEAKRESSSMAPNERWGKRRVWRGETLESMEMRETGGVGGCVKTWRCTCRDAPRERRTGTAEDVSWARAGIEDATGARREKRRREEKAEADKKGGGRKGEDGDGKEEGRWIRLNEGNPHPLVSCGEVDGGVGGGRTDSPGRSPVVWFPSSIPSSPGVLSASWRPSSRFFVV